MNSMWPFATGDVITMVDDSAEKGDFSGGRGDAFAGRVIAAL